jgi:hypothetical protein
VVANFLDPRLPGRFWDSTIPEPNSGCWLWLANRGSDGYGKFHVSTKYQKAHRVSYEALVGPIPKPLVIDHLCLEKSCCNPAHLEPVSVQENTRRARALITHCPNGHEFTPDNLRLHGSYRSCRECNRLRAVESRARLRAGFDPAKLNVEVIRATARVVQLPEAPKPAWLAFRNVAQPSVVVAMCDEIERLRILLDFKEQS